jgi:hypothetical protein
MEFVTKYYEMDPIEEDLLIDGSKLENDMVVLIEDPEFRVNVSMHFIDDMPATKERALRWNRWATVSEYEFDTEADEVIFVAVYEDGTKKKQIVSADKAWFVKLYSMENIHAAKVASSQENPGLYE